MAGTYKLLRHIITIVNLCDNMTKKIFFCCCNLVKAVIISGYLFHVKKALGVKYFVQKERRDKLRVSYDVPVFFFFFLEGIYKNGRGIAKEKVHIVVLR